MSQSIALPAIEHLRREASREAQRHKKTSFPIAIIDPTNERQERIRVWVGKSVDLFAADAVTIELVSDAVPGQPVGYLRKAPIGIGAHVRDLSYRGRKQSHSGRLSVALRHGPQEFPLRAIIACCHCH